jgi:ATP-dependent DNA helicase PIF1
MTLSAEQNSAMEEFANGDNILITGPGGSGKSYLIKLIKENSESRGKNIQVCAMTGCAAVLLQCKAKTVHSWGGIGIGSGDPKDIIKRVIKNKHKKKAWKAVDVLVIDEVSMMSKKMFEIIDAIARTVRGKKELPFGGIQMVLSGDFYQLPPIGDQYDEDSSAFCFESDLWNECIPNTIQLTTIYRQSDSVYKKILNQIRIGKVTPSTIEHLSKRVNVDITHDIVPTILYPTRKQSDDLNNKEYKKLTTAEEFVFEARINDNVCNLKEEQKNVRRTCGVEYVESEATNLTNSVFADKTLKLKVGTRVMCTANIDQESELPIVNGSQGVVISFSENTSIPLVKFQNGSVRQIGHHSWSSEHVPGLSVEQIPLIYSWALTIHKSQGVTLDAAQIDAGSRIFECGQTYVALSRVKDLSGLYLTAFNYRYIKVNKKAREFYERLIV